MKYKKKDLRLFATKLTSKIPDPCNAKKHHQSLLRKKNVTSVKQSKLITLRPKTLENPNIDNIKSKLCINYPRL